MDLPQEPHRGRCGHSAGGSALRRDTVVGSPFKILVSPLAMSPVGLLRGAWILPLLVLLLLRMTGRLRLLRWGLTPIWITSRGLPAW